MIYIVLDFETHDPWIEQGRGSGCPQKQAKFLCAATHCNGLTKYWDDIEALKTILTPDYERPNITIIAHNAQYEAGILHSYGFNIESVTWIDTMILAKLFYNNLLEFGLDALSQKYLGETKDDTTLGAHAKELGLVKTIAQDPVKIAKKNMETIFERFPKTVENYVKQDVLLCHRLYKYFMFDEAGIKRFSDDVINFHSDLIKALTLSRARGVRVHVPTAYKVRYKLFDLRRDVERQITGLAPHTNVNSSQQLAQFFTDNEVQFPRTEKGNPSITKEFLDEVDHPIGKLINEYKKITKLIRDFIDPILELAEPVDQWGHMRNSSKEEPGYIRVYPEVKIYGAAATGRASCSTPNLQQVPKRGGELSKLIRTMYHPEEGEQWFSFDFSSQESRLQVHYAGKIGAAGASIFIDAYKENPNLDLHQKVADLAGIARPQAKTINLGLSYGMGDQKLAHSLKLSMGAARALKTKFNNLVPFLTTLDNYSRKVIKGRGYLLTLNGRKLYNETGFERKALNKLIQGSAADQMWTAIVNCYRQKLQFMFPVHDSLECSIDRDSNDVEKIKIIMESTHELCIPMVVEVESGNTWGDLE